MRQIDITKIVGRTKIHEVEVTFELSDYILCLYLLEDLARELRLKQLLTHKRKK